MHILKQTIVGSVVGLLLALTPAFGEDTRELNGLWKLVAFYGEDVESGARSHAYGKRPVGYMHVGANGAFHAWAMSDWPDPKSNDLKRAAASRAVYFSGTLRGDRGRLLVAVEKALHEGFFGTDPVDFVWTEWPSEGQDLRSFELTSDAENDEFLRIATAPMPNPNGAGNMVVGTTIWLRSYDWEYAPSPQPAAGVREEWSSNDPESAMLR